MITPIGNYYFSRGIRVVENQKPETKQQLLDVITLSPAAIRIIDQYERLEKMKLNIKE